MVIESKSSASGSRKRKITAHKNVQESEAGSDEVLLLTTDLDGGPEEVQYTDTSYTSASFESLPPASISFDSKKKRKKKSRAPQSKLVPKVSSDFLWSEESLIIVEDLEKAPTVVEEEEKIKQRKRKIKRRRKSKKDKKGQKKDEEVIPEFEKPKKWKKMNKKERQAWLEQQIEEYKAQKEAEKQAYIAGIKEKRKEEAKERAALMAKDIEEQEIRRDLLQKTVKMFHNFEMEKQAYLAKKQDKDQWLQYLRCDGLPDPRLVTQMNTYLHLWKKTTVCDDEELQRRCIETLPMLEMLEDLMANSRNYTQRQIENYNEIRFGLREQLNYATQYACYTLLRDLEKRLKFESIKLATYEREFKGLRLNIWVAIRMPTRLPKPVETEPDPVELSFPAMKVTVKLPKIIDSSCACVRAAKSTLDLLSESSRTYPLLADMPNRYEDLYTFNVKEHTETYKLKEEQDEIRKQFFKQVRERTKELEAVIKANVYVKNKAAEDEIEELAISEPKNVPDPRTFIAEQNEVALKKYLKSCSFKTRKAEINLRKYRICGGVLNLDLLETPPQPKRMRGDVEITTLHLPKWLTPLSYQVQYRAPSPPPPGVTRTPEEIELEMKRIEAQYEKLTLIHSRLYISSTVHLPKWLQPLSYQVQYRAPSPPLPGVTRTPEEIKLKMKRIEAQYEKLTLIHSRLYISSTVHLPKWLQPLSYQVQYRAPSPPPPGVTRTPEEIELEMKRIEAQYEKLALIHSRLFISSTVHLPKWLQPLSYQVQYRAPSPPPPGVTRTPEEIELEMKRIEAQYEKLALIHIDLPHDVMWVEPPVVCQWHENKKLWTSNYINDFKFNEDKLTVQFRTGVLWPIGLATMRYSNLPYQGWDVRPDPNGKGVTVNVTGICLTVTFTCTGNHVKLKSVTNATTPALSQYVNKKFTVRKLVQIMRSAACDFFPDFDGHNYVDGSCPKEWVLERHTYHAMAFLSRGYNFQWSRWNVAAGQRNIVMQIREAVDNKREGKLQLLKVTPQNTTILQCNEMSTDYSDEPMLGMKFFPDLFTLNMSWGSLDARRIAFNMNYKLVETVFELLQELKLCSYS